MATVLMALIFHRPWRSRYEIKFRKFKISGGIDESFFDEGKIESGGKLLFKNPPDYESPADADGLVITE